MPVLLPVNNPPLRLTKKLLPSIQSLQDVIGGDVVGTGYHSLVKQLKARVENPKRPSEPRIMKRKRESDENETEEIPAEQRTVAQDTYGCIKWDMKFMPVNDTTKPTAEERHNEGAL